MNINQEFETIAAISTPIGTGGVGVIRISGDKSFEIALKVSDRKTLPAGKICHGWILDKEIKIDEVVILPFKNPNSYTGEDVVEIQCHGGVNVVRNILDVVLKNGARMAERGEFTKRAFLNKKLDLSQAEAVDDLIHAKTSNFARHGEEAWAVESAHAFSHWGGTILWQNYGKPIFAICWQSTNWAKAIQMWGRRLSQRR